MFGFLFRCVRAGDRGRVAAFRRLGPSAWRGRFFLRCLGRGLTSLGNGLCQRTDRLQRAFEIRRRGFHPRGDLSPDRLNFLGLGCLEGENLVDQRLQLGFCLLPLCLKQGLPLGPRSGVLGRGLHLR